MRQQDSARIVDAGQIPLRRANSFWDMPSWSSSSHTVSRLSFTLGGAGRLRLISPASSPGGRRRMCWLSARSASGEDAARESLVGSGRREPTLHVRMSGPFCCPLTSLKDSEPAARPTRSVRRLRRVRCRSVLLARPADGEVQRIGQFSSILGADGSVSIAVRGYREDDGHIPVPTRFHCDQPADVAYGILL